MLGTVSGDFLTTWGFGHEPIILLCDMKQLHACACLGCIFLFGVTSIEKGAKAREQP